jgi:N-acetyltransferase
MAFDSQPHLTGELLEACPLVAADHDGLRAAAADPLTWEQHPDKTRHTADGFERWFADALNSGGALTVRDEAGGRPIIGSSRYHGYDEGRSEVEIGWTFLARSHWGGRYNAELKRLMLDHAFRFVDTVIFVIHAANTRSQRAVEKLGAVRSDTRTGAGGRVDVVYRLHAGDWVSSAPTSATSRR